MTEDGASPGPGSVLRTTRESLGYTQQDVADALNLTLRAVDDLECERWERFHALTFARGYVKSYAKLLGLDPQTVVADYGKFTELEPPPPAVAVLREPSGGGIARLGEMFQRQPGTVLSGTVAIAVAAVVIALVMVWPDSDRAPEVSLPGKTALVPSAKPRDVTNPSVDSVEIGTPAAAPSTTMRDDDAVAANEETTEGESESVATTDAVELPSTASEAEQGPSVVAVPARRITPIGDDRMEFSFSSDCWVEIKDGTGQSLYSDLSRSGETLHLIGAGPFKILLGYGPGVALSFNGEPVPLARHTRNNVASVVLGTD